MPKTTVDNKKTDDQANQTTVKTSIVKKTQPKSVATKPAVSKPAASKPAASKPVVSKPVVSNEVQDTNNDGVTEYNNYETDGWALAYNNNEIASFNTTYINDGNIELLQADDTLSIHMIRDTKEIILTANTMDRNIYTDQAKTVRVTIDAQELTNNSNFRIIKNNNVNVPIVSQSNNIVTFDVETSQNSDFYTITGSSTYTVEQTPPSPEIETTASSSGGGGGSGPNGSIQKTELTVDPTDESSIPCIESWECGKWSKCENNIQTRICFNENNCDENIPSEIRNCESNIIMDKLGTAFTGFSIFSDNITMKHESNNTKVLVIVTLVFFIVVGVFTYRYKKNKI